jgi:hypothetical protein
MENWKIDPLSQSCFGFPGKGPLTMHGLTTELFKQACRTFLDLAYPGGEITIPPKRRLFCAIPADQALAPYLEMRETCEKLLTPEGNLRGYAFRLGSARFPHLKMQVIDQGPDTGCVFAVDTHDVLRCALSGDEGQEWAELQAENRRLKERIETAWEKQGLLTFNALLRRGLNKST